MRRLRAFAFFWYDFLVGDDWLLAAGVAVGILAVDLLQRSRHDWWWLLPIVVVATLGGSLRRARTRPPAQAKAKAGG
jgi:hypothetical protein